MTAVETAQAAKVRLDLEGMTCAACATRIERKYDTQHAQTAMVHAFARCSAHHFRSTSKADTFDERAAFANYIGNIVAKQVISNLEQMSGAPANTGDAGEAKAE